MNMMDKALAVFSPRLAAARMRDRAVLRIMTARYDAATTGDRGNAARRIFTDADAAGRQRQPLANIGRDLVRNSAWAARTVQVIGNNVVGDGIIPKVSGKSKREREALFAAITAHCDTTDIDADGRLNLYGLQRLVMATVVESGEVLIRRRRREMRDGFGLAMQIQVMEPDFLCDLRDGVTADGNIVRGGIEFNAIGKRVAYHLYGEHPGAYGLGLRALKSDVRRIPASEILHIYRPDRPGQSRGVSWFAPIAMQLQDVAEYMDAQILRQKIAAVFVAFRTSPEVDQTVVNDVGRYDTLRPGRIENLLPGEDVRFASPPAVEGLDEFMRTHLRSAAAGVGITYEALTGDLSQVNFSSGRMGRMEMDRNVSSWQWLMMIPQMLVPLSGWMLEGFEMVNGPLRSGTSVQWVPPHRALVDPTREIPALSAKVRAGFASRSSVIRELGYDPEPVMEEIAADAAEADRLQLIFDSDPRYTSGAGQVQQGNVGQAPDDGVKL